MESIYVVDAPARRGAAQRDSFELQRRLADYAQLVKLRLSVMVLGSALVGFWMASAASPEWQQMIWFGLGTFCVIGGANAFNQIAERCNDRLMRRTASRPLPDGRMSVAEAAWVATLTTAGGLGLLAWSTNGWTVLLAAAALGIYLLLYTPLKRISHWSTWAGAVSGAIPALMGWTAVRNSLALEAWPLFGIVFLWQFPHTWSIASAYREDFTRAGFQVLPLVDVGGLRTRYQVAAFSLALGVVSLTPFALGKAGVVYFAGALITGAAFSGCALRFGAGRQRRPAGQLMAASLAYMPLILTLLLVDRRIV